MGLDTGIDGVDHDPRVADAPVVGDPLAVLCDKRGVRAGLDEDRLLAARTAEWGEGRRGRAFRRRAGELPVRQPAELETMPRKVAADSACSGLPRGTDEVRDRVSPNAVVGADSRGRVYQDPARTL